MHYIFLLYLTNINIDVPLRLKSKHIFLSLFFYSKGNYYVIHLSRTPVTCEGGGDGEGEGGEAHPNAEGK